jgi:hypothetical protein
MTPVPVYGIGFLNDHSRWAARRSSWKYFLHWIGIKWAAKLGGM